MIDTFREEVLYIIVQKDLSPLEICVGFEICPSLQDASYYQEPAREITYDTLPLVPRPPSEPAILVDEMLATDFVKLRGDSL